MLKLVEKLDAETHAPINPQGWLSYIAALLLKLAREKSPRSLQSYFTFEFIKDNEQEMLARLKSYLERHSG